MRYVSLFFADSVCKSHIKMRNVLYNAIGTIITKQISLEQNIYVTNQFISELQLHHDLYMRKVSQSITRDSPVFNNQNCTSVLYMTEINNQ